MMTAGARAYNAANVILRRSESTSTDALVAMLASCGAPGMQASRSVGGLEETMGAGQKRPFYPMFDTSEETGDDDAGDDCAHHVEKKRRLTVDQVRSLEKNFELENKLEPERKMQLARELGLQPRQVAVWFQNRRARWKTKQLERDYDVLKLDYDALKSDYDAILADKEGLQAEVLRLTTKLQAQSKQRKLEGQVFEAEELDDLGRHLDLTLVKPEPLAQVQQDYDREHLNIAQMNHDSPVKSKEGSGGSTSSESNSSEIMNADSPRPIDSDLSSGVNQKSGVCSNELPSTTDNTNVDTALVQFAEELCGGRLVPTQSFQRTGIKLEDGTVSNMLQDECNNYFYTMDESGNLPWWEWP